MSSSKSSAVAVCECPICVEPMKVSVECPYCQYKACRVCCQTYLLGETMSKCMNTGCNREWSRHFISTAFTPSFITGPLKKHNENVLFERERSLLPATQPLVEAEIAREKDALSPIEYQLLEYHKEYSVIDKRCEAEMQLLYAEIRQVRERYDREKKLLRTVKYVRQNEPAEQPRKVFIKACSYEDCRGFLSSQWKCGICERFTCNKCHIGKGDNRDDANHTCKADDVATANLIMSDTKACPKCATDIFKVSGCDLMWCTQCHTSFSWTTGRVDTGRNHNPHYFEWLRRTGGAGVAPINQVLCGRELDENFNLELMDEFRKHGLSNYEPFTKNILQIIQSVMHVASIDLPRYNTDRFRNNEGLRVKYLRNRITEDEFKRLLQRTMKKQEKFTEIGDVLQLLVNTTTEIVYRFLDHVKSIPIPVQQKKRKNTQPIISAVEIVEQIKKHTFLKEMDALIVYVNECLQRTSNTFSSVLLQVIIYPDLTTNQNIVGLVNSKKLITNSVKEINSSSPR